MKKLLTILGLSLTLILSGCAGEIRYREVEVPVEVIVEKEVIVEVETIREVEVVREVEVEVEKIVEVEVEKIVEVPTEDYDKKFNYCTINPLETGGEEFTTKSGTFSQSLIQYALGEYTITLDESVNGVSQYIFKKGDIYECTFTNK